MISRIAGIAILLAAGAVAIPATGQEQRGEPEIPPGYGSLRQEQVAVLLDAGNVQFSILPLDERVIRLLAPDSYKSLRSLAETMAPEIAEVARGWGVANPVAFLVRVFSVQDHAEFDPEALTITSRNRFFRPVGVIPRSPLWNQHRLRQRETAVAVYVFEGGIEFFEPMTMTYQQVSSEQWAQTIRELERERARVEARIKRP